MIQHRIFTDTKKLADAVAHHFIEQAHRAIETHGRFSVALAGGSTPQHAYQLLATREFSSKVDWSNVFIFWGDERCVPPDDIDSNYHTIKEALLNHIQIPPSNIYRMEGERKPLDAAQSYQDLLVDFFGDKSHFDLVILGMGSDGHTASLFPGTEALRETDTWVSANYVDKLSSWRITLTPFVINQAHNITFVISGENKAITLKNVIKGKFQPGLYPSQLIKPLQGKLTWYLDEKAASLLGT